MCSVTQKKKKTARTVNASHTQCSAGHEILNRKIPWTVLFFFFSGQTRELDDGSQRRQGAYEASEEEGK